MPDEPTPPSVRITEETPVRTNIRTLVAIGSALGGALVLGVLVWVDIRDLKADMALIKHALGLDAPRVVFPVTSAKENG